MLDWIKNLAEDARGALETQIARFQNREFMEAVIAGCAMVAASDGNISPEEKQKMMGYMRVSRELRVFRTEEVISTFNRFAESYAFDKTIGDGEAEKAIRKLADKADASAAMIRVCCIIGAADGTFDDGEKQTVRNICAMVHQPPASFGL